MEEIIRTWGKLCVLRVLIIHSNKLEISQILNSKGLVREIIADHLGKCYIVIKNAVYRWVYGTIITRVNEKNPTKRSCPVPTHY